MTRISPAVILVAGGVVLLDLVSIVTAIVYFYFPLQYRMVATHSTGLYPFSVTIYTIILVIVFLYLTIFAIETLHLNDSMRTQELRALISDANNSVNNNIFSLILNTTRRGK